MEHMKQRNILALCCCNNDISSEVSELSKPKKENSASLLAKCSFIMQKAEECGFFLEACVEHGENPQIQFSHFPSDWSKGTRILQSCNKSLDNELRDIFTTSLTGFSTSSNQNQNQHKAPKIDVNAEQTKYSVLNLFLSFEGSRQNRQKERQRGGEGQTDRQREH